MRGASKAIIAAWSVAMIWLALASGTQHDYIAYLSQWRLVLSGADPWSTDNAYGPLHNLLAYALVLGELGPKLAMATEFAAGNASLAAELLQMPRAPGDYAIYLLAVPTNMLIICIVFVYGLNDAMGAGLIAFAIVARYRNRMGVAGGLLGLAVLLKFYPIVLVPLFALDKGRLRWSLILHAGIVVVLGFAAAFLVWGGAFLHAFKFGAARGPKLLSILAGLQDHPGVVGGRGVLDLLVRVNVLMVAAVAATAFLAAKWMRLHWLEASVVGLLAVLATYKVGHDQFYVPWLILVAALPLADTDAARRLAWLCVPYALFLSLFQWAYTYGSDGFRQVHPSVRQHVGLVAFPLALATLIAYFSTRNADVAWPAWLSRARRGPARSADASRLR